MVAQRMAPTQEKIDSSRRRRQIKLADSVQLRLNKMSEVTRLLTASLETSTVVRTIIEAIPQVIPTVEACVLMMYDPATECLIARDSIGFIPESIEKLKLKPGESLSGHAFLHNQSAMYSGEEIINEGLLTMTPYNRTLQPGLSVEQAKSVMCVPLDFKGKVLGVITVNNFQSITAFTEFDLELLQSLASQASISIENSRLYEDQRESLHRMEQMHQIITRQHQQLENALHIHRTLSGLALQNLGLGAITQALADILGQAVTVTDLLHKTVAQAEPSNSLPPASEIPANKKKQAADKNGSLVAPESNRKIYPIQAGNDKLGYIVTASRQDFSDVDFAEVAIEQAATIIALEMVKEQAIFEVERRLRGELLQELLSGRFDDSFAGRASLYGYDASCNYWMILGDINDFRGYIQKHKLDENQVAAFKRTLVKLMNGVVIRTYPKSIVSSCNDKLIVLQGVPNNYTQVQAHERALKLADEIINQLNTEFKDASFSMVVSRQCSELEHFKSRYEEVVMALQMVSDTGGANQVVDCSKLGVALLLLKLPDRSELVELAGSVLGRLVRYDRQHQSNLVETLTVYSQCNSDHLVAAQQLHVHPNTMTYRIKRVEEITERKLSNTDDWLDIQIALRLIQAYPSLVDIIR